MTTNSSATDTDSLRGDAGFGAFFRYHGWLAPGVRLFRRIGFRAKAMWIAAVFVAPLLIMLFYLWSAAHAQIEFARSERTGLTYVRPVVDLIQLAQERRRAATLHATELAGSQDRVKPAFDKVRAKQIELGKAFELDASYAALLKAHEIAEGTRQQTTGVGEVGTSVRELDQSTQRNAALVEETAAAAGALAEQSQRLSREVSFFKLA